MAWRVELAASADLQIRKLDMLPRQRILEFLRDRIQGRDNPRLVGQALRGARFGGLWRYRIGDYRLICVLEDGPRGVLVLRVGHRREVYR